MLNGVKIWCRAYYHEIMGYYLDGWLSVHR